MPRTVKRKPNPRTETAADSAKSFKTSDNLPKNANKKSITTGATAQINPSKTQLQGKKATPERSLPAKQKTVNPKKVNQL